MSSEMRDEIACEIVRNVCETDPADPDAPMTVCIDVTRLREIVDNALLARTEAGADGDGFLGFVHECVWEDGTSRTIYEKQPSLLRERPGLTSQRIVRAYTHPQDASGDAEALQDLMATVRAVALSGDYGISDEAIATLSDALDDAMQAKEAK